MKEDQRQIAFVSDAGTYRLEIHRSEQNRWEWFVFTRGREVARFFGDTATLEGAKRNSAMTIGLYSAQWRHAGLLR